MKNLVNYDDPHALSDPDHENYLYIRWGSNGSVEIDRLHKSEEGAMQEDERQGQASVFLLPQDIDAVQLTGWVGERLMPHIEELNKYYYEVQRGGKQVGQLIDPVDDTKSDEDVRQDLVDLVEELYTGDKGQPQSAYDWFQSIGWAGFVDKYGIQPEITDAEISVLAAEIEEDIRREKNVDLQDVRELIEEAVDKLW